MSHKDFISLQDVKSNVRTPACPTCDGLFGTL